VTHPIGIDLLTVYRINLSSHKLPKLLSFVTPDTVIEDLKSKHNRERLLSHWNNLLSEKNAKADPGLYGSGILSYRSYWDWFYYNRNSPQKFISNVDESVGSELCLKDEIIIQLRMIEQQQLGLSDFLYDYRKKLPSSRTSVTRVFNECLNKGTCFICYAPAIAESFLCDQVELHSNMNL
jgi:hypothetical protein